jgi:hypothetical protein
VSLGRPEDCPPAFWVEKREDREDIVMGSIFRFLKRLVGSKQTTPRRQGNRSTAPRLQRRLVVDRLEQRQLLTVALTSLPAAAQGAISAAIGQDQEVYRAVDSGAEVSLVNPASGFTAQLRSGALHVVAGADTWDMALVGLGRGDKLAPVGTSQTSVHDNRIDCNYGVIDEWYLNGPAGLEQGFDVTPTSQSLASGSLTVELALGGSLTGRLNSAGDGLDLNRADGSSALRYAGLTAYDATGRILPASLELTSDSVGQELLIHVNDTGAQGTITIDPFVQAAKLTASDGAAHDYLGTSVSISGNTIVVGAPGANSGTGAAYVFTQAGSGWANMTQTAKLTASDGASGNGFGQSVSISGSTIVVGAPNAAVGGIAGQGAAYVFTKPAAGWTAMTQTAKLSPSDNAGSFGQSVSASGSTVVVGAPSTSRGFSYFVGAAYVFVQSGSAWTNMTQTAELTASDGQAGDSLGGSVSISGGNVLVGAANATIGSHGGQGAAYVFSMPGTAWTDMNQTAKLSALDGATNDAFASSVAISGNNALVGAPNASVGGNAARGAAYIFSMPGAGWTNMTVQTAKLTASDGAVNDAFGTSVAISGSTALVGAPNAAVGSNGGQGAAYLFSQPSAGWTSMIQSGKLTATDGSAGSTLGRSVAVDGSTPVAGADDDNSDRGAAYAFASRSVSSIAGMTSAGGWWMANSTGSSFVNQAWGVWNPNVGWTNCMQGDFTGDGKADIVGRASSGEWYVGISTGTSFTTQFWGVWNPTVGWTNVMVADVNGDGKADIVGMTSAGSWFAAISTGTSFTSQFWGGWNPNVGWQSVQVADVNGDRKADIVGMTSEGGWFAAVSTGTSFTNQFMGGWNPNAGWTNVMAADANGDGMTDIVGRTSFGDWYVALSSGTSFTNQYWGSWNPGANWTNVMVADVNGDGKADIVGRTSFGDWYAAISSGTNFGSQYFGSWSTTAGWTNVQTADVNGDGKSDIVGMTSSGDWYAALSSGTSFTTQKWGHWNIAAGWQPVLAGYFA